jgi:hypothetical protein
VRRVHRFGYHLPPLRWQPVSGFEPLARGTIRGRQREGGHDRDAQGGEGQARHSQGAGIHGREIAISADSMSDQERLANAV